MFNNPNCVLFVIIIAVGGVTGSVSVKGTRASCITEALRGT